MENTTPQGGRNIGAVQGLEPKYHFEYVAIHDQRIALIRSYTVWYFIGLPTSIAVFSFFIYFGLSIGNIPLIALGGIISSIISWVTYSISVGVDRDVVALYPRIIFLEILLDCQRRSKISPPGRSKTSPLNGTRCWGGCPGSQGPALLRVALALRRSEAAWEVPVDPPGQPLHRRLSGILGDFRRFWLWLRR